VLLICLILGWLGVHRFVTGKVLSGIIYLFTFGLFGVGWAYDFLRIILGGFPDRQGRKLK
jgi:TM2 domain-containing membrane protein YozV